MRQKEFSPKNRSWKNYGVYLSVVLTPIFTAILTYFVNVYTLKSEYEHSFSLYKKKSKDEMEAIQEKHENSMKTVEKQLAHSRKITIESLKEEFKNQEELLKLKRHEFYQREMVEYLDEFNKAVYAYFDSIAKSYANLHYSGFMMALEEQKLISSPESYFENESTFLENINQKPFDLNENSSHLSGVLPIIIKCKVYFDDETCESVVNVFARSEEYSDISLSKLNSNKNIYFKELEKMKNELAKKYSMKLDDHHLTNKEALLLQREFLKVMPDFPSLYNKKFQGLMNSSEIKNYQKANKRIHRKIVSIFDNK